MSSQFYAIWLHRNDFISTASISKLLPLNERVCGRLHNFFHHIVAFSQAIVCKLYETCNFRQSSLNMAIKKLRQKVT